MYCKYSRKKHKTYDDGILVLVPSRKAILQTMEGKDVATEHTKQTMMKVGGTLSVRSYDLEVVNEIAATEYESGRIFIAAASGSDAGVVGGVRAPATAARSLAASVARVSAKMSKSLARRTAGASLGGGGAPEEAGAVPRSARARFDPLAPGAVVLQWPEGAPRNEEAARQRWERSAGASSAASSAGSGVRGGGACGSGPSRLALQQACGVVGADGRPQVPVVVDPALASALRPHQVAGIRFLWECVAGMRPFSGAGAVLADAMGLGKTLQAITLIYTALKQSLGGAPLATKAVVVCPSSLVANWRREFRKWLGDQKCRPIAVTKGGKEAEQAVKDFCLSSSSVSPVLIVSYEQFRRYAGLINGGAAAAGSGASTKSGAAKRGCDVGLLVCDEGHRLKNSDGNQTIAALAACPCRRRVILTGTPIQNRLDEFYACCSFVNPDVLGPLNVFRRVFQTPIQRGRDKSASPEEQAIGAERSKELSRVSTQFILRRTQRILDRYLPSKTESCVFCRPTALQLRLYRAVLAKTSARYAASARGSAGGAAAAEALTAVGLLRKLCNSPALLWGDAVRAAAAEGHQRAAALIDSATLRATASAVVAAMHRQMGVQGGAGGKPSARHPPAAKRSPSVASTATGMSGSERGSLSGDEDVDFDDDSDDLASLGSGEEDDDDDDDAGGGDTAASSSGASGTTRAPKRGRPSSLHGPRQGTSLLEAYDDAFQANPDPLRSALQELGMLSADGRAVAAASKLPFAESRSGRDALPGALRRAGDAIASGSGKLRLLDELMLSSVQTPRKGQSLEAPDKLVVVSNYTATLDVISGLCTCRGVPFLRLDGSTASERRATLVSAFNRGSHPSRVLLLSSKAGGVGLNLVGANRLVLFDVDWNPATDRQAMARVWRDGQPKRCAIYRFSLAGTLEEKVLQRQLLKEEVSSAIVDGDTGGARSFSADELRRLFDEPTEEPAGSCSTFAMLSERKAKTSASGPCKSSRREPRRTSARRSGEEDSDDTVKCEDGCETDDGEGGDDDEPAAAEEARELDWPPYTGPASLVEDDAVLAEAVAAAGADDVVSYAQCTWFNKGAGGAPLPSAAAAQPGGLNGLVVHAPAQAALDGLESVEAALGPPPTPPLRPIAEGSAGRSSKRACLASATAAAPAADDVFAAIMGGTAPAAL